MFLILYIKNELASDSLKIVIHFLGHRDFVNIS